MCTTVALLLVPVVGGVPDLLALHGGTPATPGPPADALTGDAELLGTVDVTASDATRRGTYASVPVGGISGIDCDGRRCLAVSDDPGQRGPVRAYPLDPRTGAAGVPLVLTDTRGVPYRPGTVDPESVRLTGDGMVWTAEGTPTVTVADRSGRARYTLPVPAGIRANQGLEGLAVDGTRVITATEAAPEGHDHPVVTVYDGADGGRSVSHDWPGTGISEILTAPDGSLLVLERGYTPGTGNSVVLWRTRLPATGTGPLVRDPVADLGALAGPRSVGNAEALAWAPWQVDGVPVLLVGTDDNFDGAQRSVVHAVGLPGLPRV